MLAKVLSSPTVNARLVSAAVRHTVYMQRVRTGLAQDMVAFLNDHVIPDLFGQLVAKLRDITDRGYDVNVEETERLQKLLVSTAAQTSAAARLLYDELDPRLLDVAMHESLWQAAMVRDVVPVTIDFAASSPVVLRSAIESRPFQGKLLTDWFDDLGAGTQSSIEQQLTIGLTQGESIDDLTTRLQGDGGLADYLRRDVESITRTATNHVMTQAREMTYDENPDVVDQVMWVSTLDSRTTPYCMSMDGRVFDVNDGPRPPAHFNCRSTTVPVLKSWDDMGIPLHEMSDGERASMNGQVPDSVTYPEWLKDQDEETQNDALGPTRAAMFRAGKLSIDKFVDDRGRVLTLDELDKKYGIDSRAYLEKENT